MLNIGKSAHIIDDQVFGMLVLMALITYVFVFGGPSMHTLAGVTTLPFCRFLLRMFLGAHEGTNFIHARVHNRHTHIHTHTHPTHTQNIHDYADAFVHLHARGMHFNASVARKVPLL